MITTLLKNFRNSSRKNNFILVALVVLLNFINVDSAKAQVSNYNVSQLATTATFPLVAGVPAGAPAKTLSITAGTAVDDATYNVAMGMNFVFNGATQTNINISTNGFVYFGAASGTPATEYFPISSANTYAGAISVYGRDLDYIAASTSALGYRIIGTAPNRIFQVEWMGRRSTGANSQLEPTNMLFQLWLYETTNVIEMHYNNFAPSNTLATGQIGLRGTANTDFKNLSYTTVASWPALPATMALGTLNTNAVSTRSTITIAAGSNKLFRWTPATCFAPSGLLASAITSGMATLTWSAASPAPLNGYDYYVTTSATPPNAGTTPTGSVGAGVLTANLTGLTAGAVQYVYVRSKCSGVDISSWSSVYNFTTLCLALNVPYYQPFDNGVGVNAVAPYHTNLPTCTSQQNVGLGNPWVTTNQDSYYPDASMDGNILMYNGLNPGNTNPANVWFFTEGINLTAGTTYTLIYQYGGTSVPSTVQNKMLVAYGTAANAASMTIPLDDHPDIKSSAFNNIVNFTAPSTGIFYFGFNAYSNPNNGKLYVDDIQVVLSSCLRPTTVSVSSISATTAILSWTAPTPAPASGYAYYYSTSPTPPVNSTVASGTTAAGVTNVTLTGLTPSTNYYFWVRGNCGFGEFGEWVALDNAGSPFFTTLVAPPVYCTPAPTSVDNQGIINVVMGSISNATGAEPGNYGNYTNLFTNTPQGVTIPVAITFNTFGFNYNTKIWVDWNNDGDFIDAGENVYAGLSATTSPNTLNASFLVPLTASLGFHRLRIGGADIDTLNGTGAGQGPCYNGAWGTFEDYSINVVVPPPPLTISSSTVTLCAGTNSPLITITTPLANFDAYNWFPTSGVTGDAVNGYIINSNTTITYTLTGSQSTAPFSTNTATFTYVANPLPTPITITTPSGTVACPGGAAGLPLVATGGIVSGIAIMSENFNGATNSWTTTNNGGNALGLWTLRPNGYNVALGSLSSNDSSQLYLADSDSGLTPATTVSTFLTSPAFSTVGYTQASLSFWHAYRYFSGDSGKVQVSINGTTWTDLATYSSNQAALANFQNVIIPLNAYLGQPTVYIRFRYDAGWDWFWAVDNVLVSGSTSSAVVWNDFTTPVANGVNVPGLFTDAAATVPYTAGTGLATVYAQPSVNTTYSATASTPAPVCTSTANVAITTTPITTGVASANQIVCYGNAADLTLVGFTGSVVKWQYASNATFTVGVTDIPASASATLTSAQIGGLTATRYYRAVVTNGSCTANSNVVTISVNSTTWTGGSWSNGLPNSTTQAVFDDDYNAASDPSLTGFVLNACSVSVTAGIVTFDSGYTLNVENVVNNSGGDLIFENNASLVQPNNVTNVGIAVNGGNVGNIYYKRNTTPMNVFDYTYWSSPVSPQTLVDLSPLTLSDKYYLFNQVTYDWANVNANNLMNTGKGYIIRAPQGHVGGSIYPGTFFGIPNNGTITTPIVMGTGDLNLIGNPYPSALRAISFLSDPANVGVVDATIYLWTHNTPIAANNYNAADYALYNYSGGIGTGTPALGTNNSTPNGFVASGQSFFIKGINSGGSATFKNSMRSAAYNNTQFYRTIDQNISKTENAIADLERNRVWLEIFNNQGGYKQTMVGYIENATNDLDRGFDGTIVNSGNSVLLYSILNQNKLGIQGRALPFDVNDIVPLGYSSNTATAYTIRLMDFDGLFSTQNIYLEDKLLNVIHDLKASNYTFTTATGTFEDRFQLRFTTTALQVNESVFNDESVIIYKENQSIHINASNTEIESIQVFDIRGRQLFNKNEINNSEFVISNLNSSQQVLLVKVTSVDGRIVNKKIVF